VCSAAQWYPGPARPQGPSEFYEFVSGQADLVTERFHHAAADVDPEVSQMRARQAARRQGRVPADTALSQPSLFDVAVTPPAPIVARAQISATDLVSLQRCPRQYYWLAVRPLPRHGSAAAQLGTSVHRWIEERATRHPALPGLLGPAPPLVEFDPDGDRSGGEWCAHVGEGRGEATADARIGLSGRQAAFLATPYAQLEPWRVEAPFVLAVGGHVVRGRIDAMYQRDGYVDIVDFKTGADPVEGDPGASVQLDTYAVAAVDVWAEDPDKLRTTYCYLRPDGTYRLVESDWTAARVAAAREGLLATLDRRDGGQWPATPGQWCRRCEWLAVCPAGQSAMTGAYGAAGGAESV
jgi:RecB family exonuclease